MGLLASIATGVALWRWGGAFAMAAFLFNGGLAVLLALPHPDIDALQEHLDWKSIPLALFVTQRGLLYAIPAGLALGLSPLTVIFTTTLSYASGAAVITLLGGPLRAWLKTLDL